MKEHKVENLAKKIINWAKEQSWLYSDDIHMRRVVDENGELHFVRDMPAEAEKFVVQITKEITALDYSSLRNLEDRLLHIPSESSFNTSQVILLNAVRSVIFIEQNNRRGSCQIEPGE